MLLTRLILFYFLRLVSTITIKPEVEKIWPQGLVKTCKGTAIHKSAITLGNFTQFDLDLSNFTANTVLTLKVESDKSYYDYDNNRTSLKEFVLHFGFERDNDTKSWKKQRVYKSIFKYGPQGEAWINDDSTKDFLVTILPIMTVFNDGNMRLVYYVSAVLKSPNATNDETAIEATTKPFDELKKYIDKIEEDHGNDNSTTVDNNTKDTDSETEKLKKKKAEPKKDDSEKKCIEVSIDVKSIEISHLEFEF